MRASSDGGREFRIRSLGLVVSASMLAFLALVAFLWWRAENVEPPRGTAGGPEFHPPIDRETPAAKGEPDPLAGPSRVVPSESGGAAPASPPGPAARARVVDALSGKPIASALVRTHPQGADEFAADEEGWLELGPFIASSARALDVFGEGHFPGRFQRAAVKAQVDAGTTPLLKLLPAATMRARVQSDLGEALAGVNLELWLRDERAFEGSLREHLPAYSPAGTLDQMCRTLEEARARGAPTPRIEELGVIEAVTDERGEFTFPPLPAGVALVVRCGGPVQPAEVEFVLPPGPGETVVELVGRVGARVTGRLVRGGEPLGQEHVQIDSVASRKKWEAYTSAADGSFVVDGVSTGRATLFVEQPAFELLEFEVVAPRVDLGDILLPELSHSTGRLRSREPFPGPETFAISFASGRSPWVGVRTDREGRFRVRLPAARYEAIFAVAGMPGVTGSFTKRSLAAPFTDFELDVDPFLGSVCFSVEGSAGDAPDQIEATLFMLRRDESDHLRRYGALRLVTRSLTLDDAGRAAWHHIVPGRHDLSIARAGHGAVFVQDVEVRAGARVELGRLELGLARLGGRVTSGRESELSELELSAVDLAGQRFSTPLDEMGSYSFERLAPGPWRVELRDRTAGSRLQREILLRAGENRLDLALPPSARLEGLVEAGADPVGGARAQLFLGGRPRVGLTALARAESDAAGRFLFDTIAPGSYLLVVEAPGPRRRSLRMDLELTQGESRSLELRLEREQAEVRFILRGEVLLDIEEVWAFIGSLPEPVEFTSAAPAGEGWAVLPASPAPIFFLLRRTTHELDPTAWVHLPRPYVLAAELPNGLRPGERREVRIEGALVELRHPAHLPRTLLPTLDIEGFADFDLLRHLPPYSLAPLERHPDKVRFGPVPHGAQLLLTGIDDEGRLREHRFRAVEDVVLEWP